MAGTGRGGCLSDCPAKHNGGDGLQEFLRENGLPSIYGVGQPNADDDVAAADDDDDGATDDDNSGTSVVAKGLCGVVIGLSLAG